MPPVGPVGVPPVGYVEPQSHPIANLFQGLIGAGIAFFCGPIGWFVGGALMVDAFSDWMWKKGIFGLLTGSNIRSGASMLVEALAPPRQIGVQTVRQMT